MEDTARFGDHLQRIGHRTSKGQVMDTKETTLAERIGAALESYTKKVTASPEAARKAMIESGIWLENGELSPNYRPTEPKKPQKPDTNR